MSFNPDQLVDAVNDNLSNDRDQIDSVHHHSCLSSYPTNRVSLSGPFGLSSYHPSNNQSAMSAAAAAALLIQAAAGNSGNSDVNSSNCTNPSIPGRRCSTASLFESPQPSPSVISAAAQQALAAAHVMASPHSPSGSSAAPPSFQAAVLSLALAASSTCTTTTSNASGVNDYHQRSAMSDLISLSEQHPELLTAHSTLASVFRRRSSTLAPPCFTNAINLSCTDTSGLVSLTQNEAINTDEKQPQEHEQQTTMFLLPNSISTNMNNCNLQFQNNQLLITDYNDEIISSAAQTDSSVPQSHKSPFINYGFRNFDQHHELTNSTITTTTTGNNINNDSINRHPSHHPHHQQQQQLYYGSMNSQPTDGSCVKPVDRLQRPPHLQHQYQINLDETGPAKVRTVLNNLGSSTQQVIFDGQSTGFFKIAPNKLEPVSHQQQQQHSVGTQPTNLHPTFDRHLLSTASTPNNLITNNNKLNTRYYSPVTVTNSNDLLPSFGCASSSPLSCSSSLSNAATTPTVNADSKLKLSTLDDPNTLGMSSTLADKSGGRNANCMLDDAGGGVGDTTCTRADEPTRKREQRLMKNREAARECRRKKKEYVKCLEARVSVLESQNQQLIEELRKVKAICFKELCGLGLNSCAAAVLAAVNSVSTGGGGSDTTSLSETINSFANDTADHRDLRQVISDFTESDHNNQLMTIDERSRSVRRRRRSVFTVATSTATTKATSFVSHQTAVPTWLGSYNIRPNTSSPSHVSCQPATRVCPPELSAPTEMTDSLDYVNSTRSAVHSPHLSIGDNIQLMHSNEAITSTCSANQMSNNQSQNVDQLSHSLATPTTPQTSSTLNTHHQQSWKPTSYHANSLENTNGDDGNQSSTENTTGGRSSMGMYHHPRYAVKRAYRNLHYPPVSSTSAMTISTLSNTSIVTGAISTHSATSLPNNAAIIDRDLMDDDDDNRGDEDEEDEEEDDEHGLSDRHLVLNTNNHTTGDGNSTAEAAAFLAAAATAIVTKCDSSSAAPELSKLSV